MSRHTKKQPPKNAGRSSQAPLASISEADTIDINGTTRQWCLEMLMGKRDLNSVLADMEKLLEADREAGEDNFQLSIFGLLFNVPIPIKVALWSG